MVKVILSSLQTMSINILDLLGIQYLVEGLLKYSILWCCSCNSCYDNQNSDQRSIGACLTRRYAFYWFFQMYIYREIVSTEHHTVRVSLQFFLYVVLVVDKMNIAVKLKIPTIFCTNKHFEEIKYFCTVIFDGSYKTASHFIYWYYWTSRKMNWNFVLKSRSSLEE